jgi:K+-transporting ATPase ATPase C chain
MLRSIRPAIVMVAFFTLLLGLVYPLTMTGAAQALFPAQANGNLIRDADGQVIGSALIGQPFTGAAYLQPRPSAAGDGYDAAGSSGSNYGPLNEDLKARVAEDATAIRAEDGPGAIPADAVTADYLRNLANSP